VACHCSISARQPGEPFSGFSPATFERKRITSGIRVGIVLKLFNGRLTLLKVLFIVYVFLLTKLIIVRINVGLSFKMLSYIPDSLGVGGVLVTWSGG